MNKFVKGLSLRELLDEEGFLTPVRLRRIFLMLARHHFSDSSNYIESDIDSLVYNDDSKISTLDVDLDFTYNSEEIGKKPAIFVGTSPFVFQKQVVDDYSEVSEDRSIIASTTQCSTSLSIRHITTAADLSLCLASQTANYFGSIRPYVLSEIPGSLQFEMSQLTSPAMVEDTKIRVFQSNVEIKLAFNTIWMSYIESLRIKNIMVKGRPVTN